MRGLPVGSFGSSTMSAIPGTEPAGSSSMSAARSGVPKLPLGFAIA
jgi:hypothetical protein